MKQITTLVLTLAVLACLLTPTLAADVSLGDVLMGKIAPLTIRLGDVTPKWSQFTLANGSDLAPSVKMNLGYFNIDQQYFNSYFTKGETVSSGGETFLIAYCRPNPVKSILQGSIENMHDLDVMEKIIHFMSISKDTPLNLCLLNLKDTGNILDIHPADIAGEIFPSEGQRADMEQRAQQAKSQSNLRQLALSAIMWSNENDECLPTLSSETEWVKELQLVEKLIKQPFSGETYGANPALSGKYLGEIPDPTRTPIFYETTPWPDGGRAVAFVDGHVEMVGEGRWEGMQQEWGLK